MGAATARKSRSIDRKQTKTEHALERNTPAARIGQTESPRPTAKRMEQARQKTRGALITLRAGEVRHVGQNLGHTLRNKTHLLSETNREARHHASSDNDRARVDSGAFFALGGGGVPQQQAKRSRRARASDIPGEQRRSSDAHQRALEGGGRAGADVERHQRRTAQTRARRHTTVELFS